MHGVQEISAVEVTVFRGADPPLKFGLHSGTWLHHHMDGLTAPVLSLQVQRRIGQGGNAAFALPGKTEVQTGQPWSTMIRLGDFVQIDATVQRTAGPQGAKDGYSHPWRTIFFGRVLDLENAQLPSDGGFVYTTMVTCDDFLSSLDAPHFTYWRKLGETFGVNGDLKEKLDRLDKLNLAEVDVNATSVPLAAAVVLEAFIEGRLDIKATINKTEYDHKDTYGFRFEGDDLRTNFDLNQLAPEAQSWKEAFDAAIDSPVFYEVFQDSLPKGAEKALLAQATNGEIGRSLKGQERTRAPKYLGRGDFGEYLIVRPAPFPVFRDELKEGGGSTGRTFYSQASWDSLPIIEAMPWAEGNLNLQKTRKHLASAFSVNIAYAGFGGQANPAMEADNNAQVVGDLHKMLYVTGYVPMDVMTKRKETRNNSEMLAGGSEALSRTLAQQLFSFNQLNDIYESGTSSMPLDLRVQLGHRWRQADYLFYIEGYRFNFSEDAAVTQLDLTRGLPVEYYGLEPKLRPKMDDKMNYVKKYLGRQRPGEKVGPQTGRAIMSELNQNSEVAP